MTDDVKNPTQNVPIGLLAQQIGSTTTLFVFYVILYYSVSDFDAILATSYPSPVAAVYQQATLRNGATLALLILLLVTQVVSLVGYISAAIRLLYGFGRNGSLTNPKWWSKIDTKHNIPINVLYVITAANVILGFIYLASDVGFQILLGSANCLFGKIF
ncbi:hypothetical protein G7Z17_g479 [Cylindrodendrum hubeiense]|uniref:Uncharacterized protein n=1 Tax=Cylindrodendrum hubeiense TaxID=595255 RepID=A0A9P5HK96_9HYPO|nr:hypothetical protein G7Z17_g479 [Cylindrodendrum hubeiense]